MDSLKQNIHLMKRKMTEAKLFLLLVASWLSFETVLSQVAHAGNAYVSVYDPYSSRRLSILSVASVVYTVKFIDKDILAYGHSDFSIRFVNWKTLTQTSTIPSAHTATIRSLELLAQGFLASASDDDTIKVWNLTSNARIFTLTNHTSNVNCLKVNANSGLLASGSSDSTVRIWNWQTGELLHTLLSSSVVNTIDWVSSTVVACGGNDGKVIFWNIETEALLIFLSAHSNPILAIAFYAPSYLVTTSTAGYVKFWQINQNNTCTVINSNSLISSQFTSIAITADLNLTLGAVNGGVYRYQQTPYTNYATWTSETYSAGFAVYSLDSIAPIDSSRLRLFIGSYLNQIMMWNPRSVVMENFLTINSAGGVHIRGMVLINQNLIATASEDNTVQVYDWSNNVKIWSFTGHTGSVMAIEFLADGQTLASGSRDNTVKLWNLQTGSLISTLTGHTNDVMDVKQLYSGYVASGSLDAKVRIWSPANGSTIRTLSHVYAIYSLCVLPNGNLLAGTYNQIYVWNADTGVQISSIGSGTNAYACSIRYLYNNMIAVGYSTYIRILNITSGTTMYTMTSAGTTWGLDLVQQDYLASCDDGNYWHIWHIPTQFEVIKKYNNNWMYDLMTVDLDAPQLKGAIGTKNGTVYIWDIYNNTIVNTINPFNSPILAIKFLNYKRIVVAGAQGAIQIWDPLQANRILSLTGQSGNITCLEVLDNNKLATGSSDGSIMVWSYVYGTNLYNLTGHMAGISSLKFLNGYYLASASYDSTIKIWSSTTLVFNLTSHNDSVLCLEIVQNASLASGSSDTSILIWDIVKGTLIKSLLGHTGAVNSLKYLSSLGYLASASTDTTIKIWDVSLGTLVKTLLGHQASVMSLDLLSDGVSLISGSLDTNAYVWNVSNGSIYQSLNHSVEIYTVEIFSYDSPSFYLNSRDSDPNDPDVILHSSNNYLVYGYVYFQHAVYSNWTFSLSLYYFNATSKQNIGNAQNITYNINSDQYNSVWRQFPITQLNYGLYRIVVTFSAYTYDLRTWFSSQIDTYFYIKPQGFVVRALANASVNTSIARYSSLILAPLNYSYDQENFTQASQLSSIVSFQFYCQRVNKTRGFVYFLNQTNVTDLKTAQSQNQTLNNSCFSSSNGYYFDSSANYLYLNPNSLIYSSDYNNQFIITTSFYGVSSFQMVFVNIDPTKTQLPTGNLSVIEPTSYNVTTNSAISVDGSFDILLKANCSFGYDYADSVFYTFVVKEYNNSVWTTIDSNSSKYAYLSVNSSMIRLKKELFISNVVAWQVSLVITTVSYGFQTNSTDSITQTFILNQIPYSICNSTFDKTVGNNYTLSCRYTYSGGNTSSATQDAYLKDNQTVFFSPLNFAPNISYDLVNVSYSVYNYNKTTESVVSLRTSSTTTSTGFSLSSLSYGWYLIELKYWLRVKTPTQVSYQMTWLPGQSSCKSFLEIKPSGLKILSLANQSVNATVPRYQSLFALTPVNFSYDIDHLANMSSVTFKFYCRVINSTFVYFANETGVVDLLTSKQNGTNNTCFKSTAGFYFDSTNKTLQIVPSQLNYQSGYNNEFIVTSTYLGVLTYQVVFVNIDPSQTQIPAGNMTCLSNCSAYLNSSMTISPWSSLIIRANCTSGCDYVDSIVYNFTVKRYNHSQWETITAGSSDYNYLNMSNNLLTIDKKLFQSGLVSWMVKLTITTNSYGVQTTSNASMTQIYVLDQLPYLTRSNYSINRENGSNQTNYKISFEQKIGSNSSNSSLSLTLLTTDMLDFGGSGIVFTPVLNYSSYYYSTQLLQYNVSTGKPGNVIESNDTLSSNNVTYLMRALDVGWYQVIFSLHVTVSSPVGFINATFTNYINFVIEHWTTTTSTTTSTTQSFYLPDNITLDYAIVEALLNQVSLGSLTIQQVCEILESGLDVSNCIANCSNNGLCRLTPAGLLTCNCTSSVYTGLKCDQYADPCSYTPCLNNGTCISDNSTGEYQCICNEYYVGSNCQTKINLCQNETCSGNGVCKDLGTTIKCNCFSMYEGEKCETSTPTMKTTVAVISTAAIIAIVIISSLYGLIFILDLWRFALFMQGKSYDQLFRPPPPKKKTEEPIPAYIP